MTAPPGAMLGFTDPGGKAAFDAAAAALGKGFAATCLYERAWRLPAPDVQAYIDTGKLVLWSNKPPVDPATGRKSWARVADGSNDGGDIGLDAQINQLQSWAVNAAIPVPQVILIFSHEPHNEALGVRCSDPARCFGTAEDFKAAFRHVHERIAALGAIKVKLAYCAVARYATPADASGVIGSGDPMYPGSTAATPMDPDPVDLLAHDVYNYFHYVPGGDGVTFDPGGKWRSASERLGDNREGVVALAKEQNKRLFIAEIGSHPGCTAGSTAAGCDGTEVQSRDDWFRDLAFYVNGSEDARNHLVGFTYFHEGPPDSTWNWRFVNQDPVPPGKAGWADAFVHDTVHNGSNGAYYTDVPFPL